MKIFLILALAIMSLSASAAFLEVECTGQVNGDTLNVGVDEGFGPNSFRRAQVYRTNAENRQYSVIARGSFGNRVRYEGAGFDLEVDFWPDVRPQWARTYRGNFTSTDMNVPFTMLWCRFPNIRP